jgi:hypothetical protein
MSEPGNINSIRICRGLDDEMLQPICRNCVVRDNPDALVRELCDVISWLRFRLAIERKKENKC